MARAGLDHITANELAVARQARSGLCMARAGPDHITANELAVARHAGSGIMRCWREEELVAIGSVLYSLQSTLHAVFSASRASRSELT